MVDDGIIELCAKVLELIKARPGRFRGDGEDGMGRRDPGQQCGVGYLRRKGWKGWKRRNLF